MDVPRNYEEPSVFLRTVHIPDAGIIVRRKTSCCTLPYAMS
jgi:hypothetical protein